MKKYVVNEEVLKNIVGLALRFGWDKRALRCEQAQHVIMGPRSEFEELQPIEAPTADLTQELYDLWVEDVMGSIAKAVQMAGLKPFKAGAIVGPDGNPVFSNN